MATDLDPLFLKAIALLNSRHTDSGRQLSALIQDYRDKLRGEPRREKVCTCSKDGQIMTLWSIFIC